MVNDCFVFCFVLLYPPLEREKKCKIFVKFFMDYEACAVTRHFSHARERDKKRCGW